MSLKSTICIPNEICPHTMLIGFVGISSLDHLVYIYQLKRTSSLSHILVIYQGNPLVPSSWNVFKEIEPDNPISRIQITFNADCTKMAFRAFSLNEWFEWLNELWLLDMNNGEIEKQLVVDKLSNDYRSQLTETSVGWVEVSLKHNNVSCYKTFADPEENPILITFADTDNAYDRSDGYTAGLTYDSFLYITFSNTEQHPWKLCKLVSYDFSSGNSIEMAFDQWNSSISPYRGPILFTNSNQSYLIRPSEDLGNRVYLVEHDHLGIKLTYLNQIDDQFISHMATEHIDLIQSYHSFTWCTTIINGDNKIAKIQEGIPVGSNRKYLLTVTNVTVPSLKSLAVWAIQNHYGHIGNDGELVDGISEEKLKKIIKYQSNKKLF